MTTQVYLVHTEMPFECPHYYQNSSVSRNNVIVFSLFSDNYLKKQQNLVFFCCGSNALHYRCVRVSVCVCVRVHARTFVYVCGCTHTWVCLSVTRITD